jgi:GT2 family glycosyltransferase
MSDHLIQRVQGGALSTADAKRIASVVLNFNSDADVEVLLPQLLAQQAVRHTIFVVDNASTPECVKRLRALVHRAFPMVVEGGTEEIRAWIRSRPQCAQLAASVFLVLNPANHGYSAGNNVGIRLAQLVGAEAVLIANPDMRIEDAHYVAKLADVLFADDRNCIAASRIVGLDGEDQSPMREPGFWEELLWPRFYLARSRRPLSYVLPLVGSQPVGVPKVSGCCMLLRMTFLEATDFLDEGVFLYCEEPILSAKVRRRGGRIVCAPALSALHAHRKSAKAHASARMLLYIRSRLLYLDRYSEHGVFARWVLRQSYLLLALVHKIKSRRRSR